MTAQIIAAVLIAVVMCAVVAYVLLMLQAGRHSDERAALTREVLDAVRAGRAAAREQRQAPEDWRPGTEWWDRQFDGIAAELGDGEGEGL